MSAALYIHVVSPITYPPAYRGMDGVILDSEESAVELDMAGRQSKALPVDAASIDPMTIRAIRVSSDASTCSDALHFLGYDVGHIDTAGSVFSLIVHDLSRERSAGLGASRLNHYLLFDDAVDAGGLLREWRAQRSGSGQDALASNEAPRVYAVHQLPDDTRPATWTVSLS